MEEVERELKQLIIDALKLEDIQPQDIASDAPLFGSGLGLDSLDALEIAMALGKRYGVRTAANEEQNRDNFKTVSSLARFVIAQRQLSENAP